MTVFTNASTWDPEHRCTQCRERWGDHACGRCLFTPTSFEPAPNGPPKLSQTLTFTAPAISNASSSYVFRWVVL